LLGIDDTCLKNKIVLDVCCGTGFLSYHLLKKTNPKKMVLLDVSDYEVHSAKKLLDQAYPQNDVSYIISNAIQTCFKDDSFDIIIGNSFLHHFYNLPQTLTEFKRILKKGGLFLSLHEPTAAAVAIEKGSLSLLAAYILNGDRYIDSLRYTGQGIAPGSGQDVWIFNECNMRKILINSGMRDISIVHFHLLRSFFVGKFALHLGENKPNLSKWESRVLKKCIDCDVVLSRHIPRVYFGSIAIKGIK
jgi:ubiquinone/menaquinone biosynthesis C-methylase UbiE